MKFNELIYDKQLYYVIGTVLGIHFFNSHVFILKLQHSYLYHPPFPERTPSPRDNTSKLEMALALTVISFILCIFKISLSTGSMYTQSRNTLKYFIA